MLGATLTVAQPAAAEWQPERPIRVVIPYGAGGGIDVLGRLLLNEVEEQTGWTLVVENKTGGGGALGSLEVKNADPDGYTIGLSATAIFALDPNVPGVDVGYTPADFDFLGSIGLIEFALVAGKDAPFNNLAELAAYSKEKPVRFTATGRPLELSMELMADDFDIEYVSSPTSGSAESLQLVLGNHADVTISGGLHIPYVQSGDMKVITLLAENRHGYAPQALTLPEQGGKLPMQNYYIFNAPHGLPDDVKATLAEAIDNALNSQAVRDYLASVYMTPHNLGPDGTTANVLSESEVWKAHYAGQ